MGEERRWRGVGREQLYVESVGGVDGDHRFAIVIQVFQEDFAQRIDLARIWRRGVTREEVRLLFEGAQKGGQFEGDGKMRGKVGGGVENEAEVEEKLIARIGGRGEADWVAEDAVRVCHDGEELGAEFLTRNYRVRYGGKMEKGRGRIGCIGRGNDRVGRDLMKNFRA